MRVLVTGGSGFVGSHVVDKLRERGIEPRIFDMVASPHHPPGEVDTHLGDLVDASALRSAMADCDAVMHLAAIADVNHVAADACYAETVNVRGTLNVLEAARAADVPRVVYASTIWVYDGLSGQVDEDSRIEVPSHFYTATKLAGEMYCRSFAQLHGFEHTILRLGIPYGPRARPAAVLPSFVRSAMDGKPLMISGDGSQSRRFVYVEDLAEGAVRALHPVAADRVYNLVGEETVTILEIASIVRALIGSVDIVHVEGRPADFAGAEVSGRRAARELGWAPPTPYAEGVRRYIEWWREWHAQERLAPTATDAALR